MPLAISKPARILLVDIGAPMGGVEVYIEQLVTIMGTEAEFYALCVMPELEQRLAPKGVRVLRIPYFPKPLRILRFALATLLLLYYRFRCRIDVVLVNGFLEAALLLPARMLGCFTIYTRHGPFEDNLYSPLRQPLKYLPRLISRRFVQFADRVVAVSETTGEAVRSVVPPERVRVIPNWVPKVHGRSKTGSPSTQANRPAELLYVGRLERYKGLYLLLEALKQVPDAHLTVLGDGSYRAELEKLASGLPVDFVGFRSDPAEFYDRADVFIMPSLGPEGLPMVALEAMSRGLPSIFSNLAVHQEISANGTAAVLFRSGDSQDLAQKLNDLLNSPEKQQAYSEQACAIVLERYSPDAARTAYIEAFGL